MNKSREEERIASAFRAGWEAGIYYERNPHTSAQLKMDADKALKRYLEDLPETPPEKAPGGITGC